MLSPIINAPITRFEGKNRFLSNFYPCEIRDDGLTFQSVETAFQAFKCENKADRSRFQRLTAVQAKQKGRTVTLRPNWEENKRRYMFFLVLRKFQSHPDLRAKLLATGNVDLMEGNNWHDNYWGSCDCPRCQYIKGENHLGKILMRVRETLRSESMDALSVPLPGGRTLIARPNRGDDYPGIDIVIRDEDGVEDQVCFAEYTKDEVKGNSLRVAAFKANSEDPSYNSLF